MYYFYWALGLIVGVVALLFITNTLSYKILKARIMRRQKWGLNICCGKTDGGGVNADIMQHADVPNYIEVKDIYNLPFDDAEFETVLCSHTLEHVDDPDAFVRELQRVGRDLTIVLPPLWDLGAVLNVLEHKWIYLSLRKVHRKLPPRIPMPFAKLIHRIRGQRIHA